MRCGPTDLPAGVRRRAQRLTPATRCAIVDSQLNTPQKGDEPDEYIRRRGFRERANSCEACTGARIEWTGELPVESAGFERIRSKRVIRPGRYATVSEARGSDRNRGAMAASAELRPVPAKSEAGDRR